MTFNFKVISLANVVQHRVEGNSLIISADPADGDSILRLNGFNFWGAKLVVTRIGGTAPLDKSAQCDSPNTIHTFKAIISRRYNDERRFLDLSDLANDTLLNGLAIFGPYSIEARKASFFTAFMKTCDDIWGTEQEKEQAVVGISLADNNIGDVEYIKMLAHTFKAIKYLDLSNNTITSTEKLIAWRFDFRFLEELILSGNQIEEGRPDYKSVLTRWFPNLRLLSNTPVRSVAEFNALATTRRPVQSVLPVLPVPILVASFRDEGAVGENFIKQFFPAYDADRNACLNAFYDAKSTFSVSINTSAPRGSYDMNVGWDAQIKKSRNLIKVTQLAAKVLRLYTGAESIRNAWNTLPSTRHPDLMTEAGKWNIECNSVPGLPDPVGQSVSGVGGLIIQVHGEFAEVNLNTNQEITTRSFDRTFILGPGMGTQGVRVVCDTLILRAYGGSDAWKPQCGDLLVAHPSEAELSIQPLIPDGFGSSHPEKSQEQLQKEILTVELSRTTRMTLEWAAKCMFANNWSIEAAAADFAAVRVRLMVLLMTCF